MVGGILAGATDIEKLSKSAVKSVLLFRYKMIF